MQPVVRITVMSQSLKSIAKVLECSLAFQKFRDPDDAQLVFFAPNDKVAGDLPHDRPLFCGPS